MAGPCRTLVLLLLALACSAMGTLQGRVLCVSGSDHYAIEMPHGPAGCTTTHHADGHDPHDDHESDADDRPNHSADGDAQPLACSMMSPAESCADYAFDVDLSRESIASEVDFPTARLSLLPHVEAAPSLTPGLGTPTRGSPAQLVASGALARLSGVILLI